MTQMERDGDKYSVEIREETWSWAHSLSVFFTARSYAERGIATSVCRSATLKYRDHIGYNTSKVISPLVSLGCSLFANPNTVDLLQREHPRIFGRNRGEVWKVVAYKSSNGDQGYY